MGKQLDGQEVEEATSTAEDLAELKSQGKMVCVEGGEGRSPVDL